MNFSVARKGLLMFCGCILMATMSLGIAASSQRVEVTLKEMPTQRGRLTVEVRNTGEKTITIHSGNLPWSGTVFRGFQLVVLPLTGKGQGLKRVYSMRNPVGKVDLAQEQVLAGTIDLYREFPELPDIRAKEDIVVFWCYSPATADQDRLPPIAGAVILTR